MPIYEYECGKCGVVEHSQRISDAALTKCPRCRRKVKRLISSTSFQLKGSGWYVTDYARAGEDDVRRQDAAAGVFEPDVESVFLDSLFDEPPPFELGADSDVDPLLPSDFASPSFASDFLPPARA